MAVALTAKIVVPSNRVHSAGVRWSSSNSTGTAGSLTLISLAKLRYLFCDKSIDPVAVVLNFSISIHRQLKISEETFYCLLTFLHFYFRFKKKFCGSVLPSVLHCPVGQYNFIFCETVTTVPLFVENYRYFPNGLCAFMGTFMGQTIWRVNIKFSFYAEREYEVLWVANEKYFPL